MNDDVSTPKSTPRETLIGDRACAHCMHPLMGSAIEREPTTGLLYVRCVECGAASALMEYPVATPWVQRMKSVVATGLVATAIAMLLVLAAIVGGLTTGAAMSGASLSAQDVYDTFTLQNPPSADDKSRGTWDPANTAWLDSPAGAEAIAQSRWSADALLPFTTILALGGIAAVPFALLIGVACMRWAATRRVLLVVLTAGIGWIVVVGPARLLAASGRFQANWRDTVLEANYLHFAYLGGLMFCGLCALCALIAPSVASVVFRAILPPRDRQLVAWIWEWRGKPVPRD